MSQIRVAHQKNSKSNWISSRRQLSKRSKQSNSEFTIQHVQKGKGLTKRSVKSVLQTNPELLEANDVMSRAFFMKHVYLITGICAFMATLWAFATVYGALFSIQAHVTTLTNLHGMISLLAVLFFRGFATRKELVVLFLLGVGIYLIMFDPYSRRVVPRAGFSMKYADLLMLFSSFPAALFFTMNKILMENRIVKHMIIFNIMTAALTCLQAILVDEATFDRDRETGLFGWTHSDNWFISVVGYGGLNTFMGNIGYLLSMHFFSPIIVMNALLIEPFFAQSIGYYVGLDEFPSAYTIGGVSIVTISLYLYNQVKQAEQEQLDPENIRSETDVEKLKKRIYHLESQISHLRFSLQEYTSEDKESNGGAVFGNGGEVPMQ